MGFTFEISVSALTIFMQGLLSFFSPCVLPLLPIYMGYLSGGTKTVDQNGVVQYKRSKVMLNTVFFVLGISFALFALGITSNVARSFFSGHKLLFSRLGGVIVILFGLHQLGIFGSSQILGQERRLPIKLNLVAMNPLTALLLGFLFSFAWTPCVGPALASVLLMASSASASWLVYAYIGVYALGFTLPFLITGLFTSALLEFFKKHRNVVSYTAKAGGILMVLMGVMMVTGWMNGVTGYLSQFGSTGQVIDQPETRIEAVADTVEERVTTETTAAETLAEETAPEELLPAPDFTLTDQYGNVHTLSEYRGKTVFLNFWATWCPPCRAEMPDIQEIYEQYGGNEQDLVVLGVAGPGIGREGTTQEVVDFLAENGYTYPVVMNEEGDLFVEYGITAYPTTFMIDREGAVFGYAQGQLTRDVIESIIQQTMNGERAD